MVFNMAVLGERGLSRRNLNSKILHKVCRLCACHVDNMQEIFEIKSRTTSDIRAKIFYCTSIEVTESKKLPSQICETCVKLLDTFYEFKMTCMNVNIQLLQLIKEDKKKQHDSKIRPATIMEHVTENHQSKSSNTDSLQSNQTSIGQVGKPVIVENHLTGPQQNLHDNPARLDNCLIGSSRHNVSSTTRLTESTQESTSSKLQSKNVSLDQLSNLSGLETIKVEVQTDPLELVSCNYANNSNEFKSEIPTILNDEMVNHNKNNNEKHVESLNVGGFIKSEEVLPEESPCVNRESSDDNIGKSCNDCGKPIKFYEQLKQENGPICTICLEHKNGRKRKSKSFECDICSKVFESKVIMSKHLKNHSRTNEYTCSICDLKFNSINTWQSHCSLKHGEGANFKCRVCKTANQYKSLDDLIYHMNKKHDMVDDFVSRTNNDNNVFLSSDQPISRIQPDSLDLDESRNIFKSTCFLEEGILKKALENRIVSHADKKSNYKPKETKRNEVRLCSYCGKIFSTTAHLSQHVSLTHLCIKKYKCKFCDNCYRKSSTLRYHVEAKHEKKKFQCTLCGNLLSSTDGLQSHMRTHENKDKAPTLKCPVCPKMFKLKMSIDRHMRTHTGETPYNCSHCPRQFTLRWNLIQHERLHTGEKRYKCEKCGKAFTHNVSRKNHMKYHKDDADVVTGEKDGVQ